MKRYVIKSITDLESTARRRNVRIHHDVTSKQRCVNDDNVNHLYFADIPIISSTQLFSVA